MSNIEVAVDSTPASILTAIDVTLDTLHIDPFAWLLDRFGLIGHSLPRRVAWPAVFIFFYVVVNDLALPLALGRFWSHPGYLSPFDPIMLPFRVVDIFLMPVIVYYYGQVSVNLPRVFKELAAKGVFGDLTIDANVRTVEREAGRFQRWTGSIWLTPIAIIAALAVAVISANDYGSPARPHLFINSSNNVLLFNDIMWFIEYYMLAAMLMRYTLLTAWLLRLGRVMQRQGIRCDVLYPDNRMGFSPIAECSALAAKVFVLALLALLFILRGNHNIGLAPTSPDWLGYVTILIISIPFVIAPIYLAHRMMRRAKDEFTQELLSRGQTGASVVSHQVGLDEPASKDFVIRQIAFVRLGQVQDWPVTIDEAATVLLTYLLGATFTIASTIQGLIAFVSR